MTDVPDDVAHAAINVQNFLEERVKEADWKGPWMDAWDSWGTVINTLSNDAINDGQ